MSNSNNQYSSFTNWVILFLCVFGLVFLISKVIFKNNQKEIPVKNIQTPKINDFRVGDCFLINKKNNSLYSQYVKIEEIKNTEITVIETIGLNNKEISFFINRYTNPDWENFRVKCPVFFLKN